MNKVILIGRVGKTPETKNINETNNVSKFSLATSEKYKDKSGNFQEETQWHNVVVWNKGKLMSYIDKGSQIAIEGKIIYRDYEKDGKKVYFTEVIAYNIELLGSKSVKKNDNFDDVPDLNPKDSNLPF